MAGRRASFVKQLVKEFLPRWKRRPPKRFEMFGIEPTADTLRAELEDLATKIFDDTIDFDEPKVSIIPKNIAPESLRDGQFKALVESAFRKKKAPEALIRSLFAEFDAAPSTEPAEAKAGSRAR